MVFGTSYFIIFVYLLKDKYLCIVKNISINSAIWTLQYKFETTSVYVLKHITENKDIIFLN